jgi:hypothetical protein
LHCSFANSSPNIRIAITFGFHRRTSVLGARGVLGQEAGVVYDEQRVDLRSSVIQVAVDARANYYPNERRYAYLPFSGREDEYRYCPDVIERVLKDYTLNDLSI